MANLIKRRLRVHYNRLAPARFTGQFDDDVVHGSLRVRVGIQVRQAGRYIVDANLYDRKEQPLAWTRRKVKLDEGKSMVELQFFGKVLRDTAAEGPYYVRQVRGMLVQAGEHLDTVYMKPFGSE